MRIIWTSAIATCLLAVATITFAGASAAQAPSAPSNAPEEEESGKPGRRATIQARMENLSKQLNLTEEQKKKIRPVLKEEFQRIRQVQSNTSLSEGQVKRRISTIRRSTRERITDLLTPEQKEKWEPGRRARPGEGGAEGSQSKPEGPGGSAAPDPTH